MAITDQDIRLMASQRLADSDDGGGRMTGTEVADGVSNNLFPDVSELDRTIGRVNLRKAFPAVLAENRDMYYGVNLIIDQGPADPNVSVTLFSTRDWSDRRGSAASRMESYLARGPQYDGYLWGQHIAGQKVLLILQRPDRALPAVGTTLVLVKNPGATSEQQQFVRVTGVTAEERGFSTQQCGSFTRTVVTAEISDALLYDVQGGTPSCDDSLGAGSGSGLYTTVVADAAKYAGIVPLAEAAATGGLTLRAGSIYTQLVPSAQSEIPITDARPHGDSTLPIAAGGQVGFTTSSAWGPAQGLYLGQGFLPGSLSVSVSGATVTDQGGKLLVSGVQIGTADSANGILKIAGGGPDYGTASKAISFIPAAHAARNTQTAGWDISPESRSGSVVFLLDPVPAPGSLAIHYMAQGQWYVLRDDGSGALRGADTSYGSGTVSFVSGSVMVTLGALPDVGTTIIATWGTDAHDIDRSGGTVQAGQDLTLTLGADQGLAPAGVDLSWPDGSGGTLTASDDGNGNLTGAASGRINYADKTIRFIPAALPPGGAQITVVSGYGPASSGIASISGQAITLSHPPVPGSLALVIPLGTSGTVDAHDDGAGNLRVTAVTGLGLTSLIIPLGTLVGSVDYLSGVVALAASVNASWTGTCTNTVTVGRRTHTISGGIAYADSRITQTTSFACAQGGALALDAAATTADYLSGAQAGQAPSQVFTWAPVIDLTPDYAEPICPGSLRLAFGGKTLIDRNGRVDQDIEPATGAGAQAGTIDYSQGRLALTAWTPGTANSGTVQALLTTLGNLSVSACTFRTAAAPLRPGSLIIQFQYADAQGTVTLTSATDGTLAAADLEGSVDFATGICRLRFGRWVTVTPAVEAQPWYAAATVIDGKAFQPRQALLDTLRYAAVAYAYIPLDKEILGIDAVRLPTDGLVPIFRPGDVAVVHHTGTVSIATPSNGLPFDCGRTNLSRVWLFDAGNSDARVATTKYSLDLAAGTGVLTDAAGLTGPIRVEHRIEDMALVSDAQISGHLTLTRALAHDYPASGAWVSSALVIGDLQAAATDPFDQQTWTGEWSDSLVGSATVAEYNSTQYAVTVTNIGAIQERWALIFNNPTEVRVIGETVGQIATLPIAGAIAPLNPATNRPYFSIDPLGWGAGWSAGNVLRFNTAAANFPVWIARTVRQGPGLTGGDGFRVQIRGDAD